MLTVQVHCTDKRRTIAYNAILTCMYDVPPPPSTNPNAPFMVYTVPLSVIVH